MKVVRDNLVYIYLGIVFSGFIINYVYFGNDFMNIPKSYQIIMSFVYFIPGLFFGLYYLLKRNLQKDFRNGAIHFVLCSSMVYAIFSYIVNGFNFPEEGVFRTMAYISFAVFIINLTVCIFGYRRGTFDDVVRQENGLFIKTFAWYIVIVSVVGFIGNIIMRTIHIPLSELTLNEYILVDLFIIIVMMVTIVVLSTTTSSKLKNFFSSIYFILIYFGFLIYDVVKYIEYRVNYVPINGSYGSLINGFEQQNFFERYRFSDARLNLLFVGIVVLIVLLKKDQTEEIV